MTPVEFRRWARWRIDVLLAEAAGLLAERHLLAVAVLRGKEGPAEDDAREVEMFDAVRRAAPDAQAARDDAPERST